MKSNTWCAIKLIFIFKTFYNCRQGNNKKHSDKHTHSPRTFLIFSQSFIILLSTYVLQSRRKIEHTNTQQLPFTYDFSVTSELVSYLFEFSFRSTFVFLLTEEDCVIVCVCVTKTFLHFGTCLCLSCHPPSSLSKNYFKSKYTQFVCWHFTHMQTPDDMGMLCRTEELEVVVVV